MGVHADELERVLAGTRLRTMPVAHLEPGSGEWDWLRNMPIKRKRRLIGAGYMATTGEMPDVFAQHIMDRVPGIAGVDDAIEWYVKRALKAIVEARRERRTRRDIRFARSRGHPTYYAYRRAQALEHGHGSLWYMRKDRGWK